jgi:hypothetical protein
LGRSRSRSGWPWSSWQRCGARILAAALCGALSALSWAQAAPGPDGPDPAARCEAAALRAARAEGVPERLMRAIALAESGRSREGALRPWPWTVNMEGEGRWFSAPGPLLDWVRARQAGGAQSFDLGCFQVNHFWHGDAFPSLEAMLDPQANATYAARFLKALKAETGSWELAAGWYHSRTPERASRYRARVLRLREGLAPPRLRLASAPAPAARPARPGGGDAAPGRAGHGARIAAAPGPDAALASLAHAWVAGGAPAPLIGARAAEGGLLRRARPLFAREDG